MGSGLALHQNTDLWRVAVLWDGGPLPSAEPGFCIIYGEHYQYTQDIDFLKSLSIDRRLVLFFMDFLVPFIPMEMWLVTNPSTSPENSSWDGGGNKPYF